jgi:hypothetical protein
VQWWREHTLLNFDGWAVAALSLAAISSVVLAARAQEAHFAPDATTRSS